jgi:hypothetical protein
LTLFKRALPSGNLKEESDESNHRTSSG